MISLPERSWTSTGRFTYVGSFTKDSKGLFVQEIAPDNPHEERGWHVISLPEGKVVYSLTKAHGFAGYISHVCRDEEHVITTLTKFDKSSNNRKYHQELQIWNMKSASKLNSLKLGDETRTQRFTVSPDDKWLITYSIPAVRKPSETPSTITIYSFPSLKQVHQFQLSAIGVVRHLEWHPSLPLMAIVTQQYPKEFYTSGDFVFSEDETEQPRLTWIDVTSGKICRKDILPSSFPSSLKFGKDGKTMLMSERGSVSLFDVPPELLK